MASLSLRVLALEGADLLAADASCSMGPIVRFTAGNAVAVTGPATADAQRGNAHESGVAAPVPPRLFSWASSGGTVELALEPVTLTDNLKVQCLALPMASAAVDIDGNAMPDSDQNSPGSEKSDFAAKQRMARMRALASATTVGDFHVPISRLPPPDEGAAEQWYSLRQHVPSSDGNCGGARKLTSGGTSQVQVSDGTNICQRGGRYHSRGAIRLRLRLTRTLAKPQVVPPPAPALPSEPPPGDASMTDVSVKSINLDGGVASEDKSGAHESDPIQHGAPGKQDRQTAQDMAPSLPTRPTIRSPSPLTRIQSDDKGLCPGGSVGSVGDGDSSGHGSNGSNGNSSKKTSPGCAHAPVEGLLDYLAIVGVDTNADPEELQELRVLDRLPQMDLPQYPLPTKLEWFCMPHFMHDTVLVGGSQPPPPDFFTFVTATNEAKLYGACLKVHTPWLDGVAKQHDEQLWAPLCLCALSRMPLCQTLNDVLSALLEVAIEATRRDKDSGAKSGGRGSWQRPLPFWRWAEHVVFEVPAPIPGLLDIVLTLSGRRIVASLPSSCDGSDANPGLGPLFQYFGAASTIRLLECALCEAQIMFVSSRLSLLTPVAEALCALLHPFSWQYPYIPVLPFPLIECIEAPMPYIMGVHRRCLEICLQAGSESKISSEVIIADIDSGQIQRASAVYRARTISAAAASAHVAMAAAAAAADAATAAYSAAGLSDVNTKKFTGVGLSRAERRRLTARACASSDTAILSMPSETSRELQSAFEAILPARSCNPRCLDQVLELKTEQERAIRHAVLRCFASLLDGYRECLFFLGDTPVFDQPRFLSQRGWSPRSRPRSAAASMFATAPQDILLQTPTVAAFMSTLTASQAFSAFLSDHRTTSEVLAPFAAVLSERAREYARAQAQHKADAREAARMIVEGCSSRTEQRSNTDAAHDDLMAMQAVDYQSISTSVSSSVFEVPVPPASVRTWRRAWALAHGGDRNTINSLVVRDSCLTLIDRVCAGGRPPLCALDELQKQIVAASHDGMFLKLSPGDEFDPEAALARRWRIHDAALLLGLSRATVRNMQSLQKRLGQRIERTDHRDEAWARKQVTELGVHFGRGKGSAPTSASCSPYSSPRAAMVTHSRSPLPTPRHLTNVTDNDSQVPTLELPPKLALKSTGAVQNDIERARGADGCIGAQSQGNPNAASGNDPNIARKKQRSVAEKNSETTLCATLEMVFSSAPVSSALLNRCLRLFNDMEGVGMFARALFVAILLQPTHDNLDHATGHFAQRQSPAGLSATTKLEERALSLSSLHALGDLSGALLQAARRAGDVRASYALLRASSRYYAATVGEFHSPAHSRAQRCSSSDFAATRKIYLRDILSGNSAWRQLALWRHAFRAGVRNRLRDSRETGTRDQALFEEAGSLVYEMLGLGVSSAQACAFVRHVSWQAELENAQAQSLVDLVASFHKALRMSQLSSSLGNRANERPNQIQLPLPVGDRHSNSANGGDSTSSTASIVGSGSGLVLADRSVLQAQSIALAAHNAPILCATVDDIRVVSGDSTGSVSIRELDVHERSPQNHKHTSCALGSHSAAISDILLCGATVASASHDRDVRVSTIVSMQPIRKGWKAILARGRSREGGHSAGRANASSGGSDDKGTDPCNDDLELRPVRSQVLKGHSASVLALATLGVVAADPQLEYAGLEISRIVSASYDGSLRIWNHLHRPTERVSRWGTSVSPSAGAELRETAGSIAAAATDVEHLCAHNAPVTCVAAWPTCPRATAATCVASGSRDGTVCLWDVSQPQQSVPPGIDDVESRSLRASTQPPARRWRVLDGEWVTHASFISSNLGSACGDGETGPPLVLSGSRSGVVQLWDSREPSEDRAAVTLQGHSGAVTKVLAGSIGDHVLASASHDCTVRLWDLRDAGECRLVLRGHSGRVTCLQHHWAQLVSGSGDGTLKMWDVNSGDCTSTFYGHVGCVSSVTGDDARLISASWDRSLRLWC